MTTALQDNDSKISSKRILAFAGFAAAVVLALVNAVWNVGADVWMFLTYSATCAGFSMGEKIKGGQNAARR